MHFLLHVSAFMSTRPLVIMRKYREEMPLHLSALPPPPCFQGAPSLSENDSTAHKYRYFVLKIYLQVTSQQFHVYQCIADTLTDTWYCIFAYIL